MGNVESSSKNNRSTRRKVQRRSSLPAGCKNSLSDRSLEEKDLDYIYKFVQHLKTTSVGADMLGEFVVKQAALVDDEINETVYGASMDDKSVPMKSIEIKVCQKDQASSMHDMSSSQSRAYGRQRRRHSNVPTAA
jgi:uncharacterized protein (UPF0212 family)